MTWAEDEPEGRRCKWGMEDKRFLSGFINKILHSVQYSEGTNFGRLPKDIVNFMLDLRSGPDTSGTEES